MIDYRQLQALSAVLKNGGFEKAANQLHLTQSAVSRRISQLELSLGEPVLIRTQPPKATSLGLKLLNHLQQVQQLEISLGFAKDESYSSLEVCLATNADSLATWLPNALASYVLSCERSYSFDFVIVDQSVGLKKMKSGEVMACICGSDEPVNGGLCQYLGELEYRAVASPLFIEKYGLHEIDELYKAPCLVFDEDDTLQHDFLSQMCGRLPEHIHYCPSSEGFLKSCLAGLGFGLLPTLQASSALQSGDLVEVASGASLSTPLYWHYWQTESQPLSDLRKSVALFAHQTLTFPL